MHHLFSRYGFGTNLHVYPLARGASLKIPSNTHTGPILFKWNLRPNHDRHNGNTFSPAIKQQLPSRNRQAQAVHIRFRFDLDSVAAVSTPSAGGRQDVLLDITV